MNLDRKQFKMEFAGKPLTLEVSKIAEQADAAVLGTYGDTTVLATVVMGKKDKESDYFPLMVSYEEKYYAAGKILGGRYMKREGRASDDAVLNGRLIDRTIRPLFNQAIRREVQVVVTVLTVDKENDPDFIGLVSASTALAISSIPWGGPVAGVRIFKLKNDSNLLINPKFSETENKELDIDAFISGTKDRINMIELEGNEADEKDVLEAFTQGHEEIKKLVAFQEKIVKEIGKEKKEVKLFVPGKELEKKVKKFIKDKLEGAVYSGNKMEMHANLEAMNSSLNEFLTEEKHSEEEIKSAAGIIEDAVNDLIHEKILKEEKRPDGRKLDELRELYAETKILKRMHGSALFVRGNTQSLSITTLGGPKDQQLMETMEFSGKKRFLLHYNFPPYSVGEIGPFRGPGRRDIGHGNLAFKALKNLIPAQEIFPYTIRTVSEILSSNGSSSMATVCAGCLSLMDAGVPIRKPAAGIAMGLILDENNGDFKVLTDIQGPEDHHGDMDFKIAGTDSGVTAMQMDVKILGVTLPMIEKTIIQAKKARLEILEVITRALPAPRTELSEFAPRILNFAIDPSRIGEVIGTGGKIINGIIEQTKVTSIDIDDDGKIYITADNKDAAEKALECIKSIVREYAIGEIVEGTVVKMLEFGAIVDFGGRDGMVHVSELREGFVKKVEDVVKMGDFVRAKIIKIENGKIGLSIKRLKE